MKKDFITRIFITLADIDFRIKFLKWKIKHIKDRVTIAMDDQFTLRDYGIRRGQHGGGRVQAVLKTTDVESP